MNHRELVLSAAKKAKHYFLQLPEELQDEVIDGLDSQTLTLEAARDLLRDRGYKLSHQAIASYYQAVRNERRLRDDKQALVRIFESFSDQSMDDISRPFTRYMMAVAAQQLAEGKVAMKVDLGKLLQLLSQTSAPIPSPQAADERCRPDAQPRPEPGVGEPGMSGDLAAWIREQVLGVRKPEGGK